ncbi:MAG: ATP synthase F1 subunit epsilon [Candidatus Portnoybacteria bacterium CG10_big_fil_rev_8_21_14_0_10_36_7]|uniref:ATP synthase epsilon chain n=1 Tax=Candidatus Portnoybacteria bacterium CG10_big_fil_rev_8_21_14_0_10_36_7 TaxID=1974812 RepID=A0A2M8KDV5_9BACT|nr:MAG: ATP synthase F1 subunit epsilon [Candidatus Portnoybacteria bacterium CG10_big_fil_rev_8_21_14_0_10_36_7]
MKIKLKIVTPERTVLEGDIDQVTLPTENGEITILPNHVSYIASLKPGEIITKASEQETHLATSGGFIEFNENNLIILSDTAERAEEIDLARAEEAKKLAKKIQEEKIVSNDTDYARVAIAIEKENARIKIAKKHHTKHNIKIN